MKKFCSPKNVSDYATHLDLTSLQLESLEKFIEWGLKQVRLPNHHIVEVLDEIYIRRACSISAGKTIYYPLTWSKKTGWHYLLEERRKSDRVNLYPSNIIEAKGSKENIGIEDDTIYLEAGAFRPQHLQEVLKELSEEQCRLFELKYLYEWSWKQILEQLRHEEPELTEPTARQRGHQLKKKLRRLILEKFSG